MKPANCTCWTEPGSLDCPIHTPQTDTPTAGLMSEELANADDLTLIDELTKELEVTLSAALLGVATITRLQAMLAERDAEIERLRRERSC